MGFRVINMPWQLAHELSQRDALYKDFIVAALTLVETSVEAVDRPAE
jgi:hypothetical protein